MEYSALTGSAGDEFSVVSLFINADIVVRLVMLLLAVSSIWSWAVAIDKWLGLSRARGKARRIEKSIADGQFPEDYLNSHSRKTKLSDAMAVVYASGTRTITVAMGQEKRAMSAQLRQEIRDSMNRSAGRQITLLEQGLGVLSTVGSTAPFVGLFGTVWGIMNAFRAIAAARETNLAVVAPGIAEALFATALGLIAAIPAVVFYNKFVSDIDAFSQRMSNFTDDFIGCVAAEARNAQSEPQNTPPISPPLTEHQTP